MDAFAVLLTQILDACRSRCATLVAQDTGSHGVADAHEHGEDRDHPRESTVRLHRVRVHVRVQQTRDSEHEHGADVHLLVRFDKHARAKHDEPHRDILQIVHHDALPAVFGLARAYEALVLELFLRGHGTVRLLHAREALGERELRVLRRAVAGRERLAALDRHRQRHFGVQHARAEREHLGAQRHDHLL
ncbi:hypothetical protein FI667_g2878, partial [Globisporangium splendens]